MTAETAQTNLEELLGPEPEETVEQVSEQVETPVEEVVAEAPVEQKPDPDEIVRNYKAMAHQERMERKQLQEQMSVMQKRFEQLMAANQQPPAPEPEYDDDPLGATHAKVDKVAKALEDMQRANMGRAQQEQFQGYVQSVKADEQAFMAKNPDYTDAITFVQMRRVNELKAMGYDEGTAMQVLAKDAFDLSQRAAQIGQSPAEFAYNLAKQTGYTPKSKGASIESIAAGQQVARSVAGGANPVTEGGLPGNLADMSDADFDAVFAKFSKK